MYHYVRDISQARFPRLKALDADHFDGQLDYIERHYNPCSLREHIEAQSGGPPLPERACILTFDDGFADHFETVFPRMLERGMTGSFFPSAMPLREGRILSVHKLQLVLASTLVPEALLERSLHLVEELRVSDSTIPDAKALEAACSAPNRFDIPEVSFLKRLLQAVLPEATRDAIVDILFSECVDEDEQALSGELYMSLPQLRQMAQAGMEIGGHGYNHRWMGELDLEEQRFEIEQSVALIADVVGKTPADWTFCYPSGSYNTVTTGLLRDAGCACGLTAEVGLTSPDVSRYAVPRLDTNDLPRSADAPRASWTNRVVAGASAS